MFSTGFAQHSLLIRDYPGAPAPGPAPAVPPSQPAPPATQPIAFAASAVSPFYGLLGAAIPLTTIATVTCADASMTIALSEVVPGLTFSYSLGQLKVSGTPAAPAGQHRVIVSYLASDGTYSVRGSTTHEFMVGDPAAPFTVGACASFSGRIGDTYNQVLCSPSIATLIDVYASADLPLPGMALSFPWTMGTSSAGTLTLAGTPTAAVSGTLTVTYYARMTGQLLCTSTHSASIVPRYTAPPSAPAPAPAPPAPPPSAPPPSAPAPAPGSGPDLLLSSVKALMRFDDLFGRTYNHRDRSSLVTLGGTIYGTTGVVDEGALFVYDTINRAYPYMQGSLTGLDATSGALAVECMVNISDDCWTALMNSAYGNRFCPVVSYLATDGSLVWSLGLASVMQILFGATYARIVQPCLVLATNAPVSGSGPNSLITLASGGLVTNPGRFVHLAGALKASGANFQGAAWLDGVGGPSTTSYVRSALKAASTGNLRVAGGVPAMGLFELPSCGYVPFQGKTDELRVTTAARYGSYIGASDAAGALIPPAQRVIPWPNY